MFDYDNTNIHLLPPNNAACSLIPKWLFYVRYNANGCVTQEQPHWGGFLKSTGYWFGNLRGHFLERCPAPRAIAKD